jgi:hypothetical protein
MASTSTFGFPFHSKCTNEWVISQFVASDRSKTGSPSAERLVVSAPFCASALPTRAHSGLFPAMQYPAWESPPATAPDFSASRIARPGGSWRISFPTKLTAV